MAIILTYTQATSKFKIQNSKFRVQLELETPLGEAWFKDNSYSGEYAFPFKLHPCALLSKSITMGKAFLNQPSWAVGANHVPRYVVHYGNNH